MFAQYFSIVVHEFRKLLYLQPGPHGQESGSSRAMENLRDENRRLMEETQTLKKQRDELQNRYLRTCFCTGHLILIIDMYEG